MPKINGTDDPRIEEAVKYIIKWPDMMVPQAMKLAGFSKKDAADKAKRILMPWMQMLLWMTTMYSCPKVKRYNIFYNICNKCMDLGGTA